MNIEYREINEIKPYKRNPRVNDKAIEYLMNSVKEFGFKVPITIDKDDVIITGHTRYEVAKRLGMDKIPTIKILDLDDNKIKAFRLADNKVGEIAQWDYEKLRQELMELKTIDKELLGFEEDVEFSWDNIEEISLDNYEEPEHIIIQCPYCNHKDRKDRFKKI